MNKVLLGFSLFVMTVLLVGCISIPLGDNALEVSTDGVEFVSKDEGDDLVNDAVDEEDGSEATEPDEEEESENASNADESETATSANGCEEQDHSQITDDIVPGFYIPDCAVLDKISKDASNLDAYFTVEGEWEETFNSYKEFFGERLHSESQSPQSGSAELTAYLNEGDANNYTLIKITQNEENVSIRVLHYFPEK